MVFFVHRANPNDDRRRVDAGLVENFPRVDVQIETLKLALIIDNHLNEKCTRQAVDKLLQLYGSRSGSLGDEFVDEVASDSDDAFLLV